MLEQVFRPQATPYRDDQFQVTGSADTTKLFKLEVDGQVAAATFTFTVGAQTATRSATVPVLTANDTFAFLGVVNIFSQKNTIDLGSGTPPVGITTDALNLFAADAASIRMSTGTWGSSSGTVHFARNSGGTRVTPAATASGSTIIGQGGSGHDGTNYTGSRGYCILSATTLWTGSNNETSWQWATCKNGATSQAERMRLTTNLLIGTTTDITGDSGVAIAGTTDATSTTTGAVQLAGGAAIIKNLVTSQGLGLGVTSTATAAGTTTLTTASDCLQIFTGTTTQTVTLPAANGFGAGQGIVFIIKNRSTGALTVNRAGSDTIEGATSLNIAARVTETLISNGVSEWERC